MHRIAALLLASVALAAPAQADLRGHGGAVRALAVSPDGKSVISGSFDTSAIVWSLESETAVEVLRFHNGAVNAVAALPDGRFASAGEDGRIAIWARGQPAPARVIEGHGAPIAGLAVRADGTLVASASWDETVRLTPLSGDEPPRVLSGHQGNVNGVGFAPGAVVSVGYDASVRIWPLDGNGPPTIKRLPTTLHSVAVAPDGGIVTGGGDGHIYILSAQGGVVHDVAAQPTPITSLALTRDGMMIAASAIGGRIVLIERDSGALAREIDSRAPVWSLAFTPDGSQLLSGGGDRLVRRWDAATGAAIGRSAVEAEAGFPAGADEHGARVFRACAACHTVTADGGNRAGPTLHGVFGRKIATASGYNYSAALRGMEIVWTPETVSRLFEIGPNAYTPGTKMPEQQIGDPQDRAALIRFLERATR